MSWLHRFATSRAAVAALACAAALAIPAAATASTRSTSPSGGGGVSSGGSTGSTSGGGTSPSGGGGLGSSGRRRTHSVRAPGRHARGSWIRGFTITEYWPVPESWFAGRLVNAPGLSGRHRIDWLYSATGVSMEGQGIGLDGRMYHIDAMGRGGWVTAAGKSTSASNGFAAGAPFWRAGDYWRNAHGAVTFPLEAGGWSAGVGGRYVPLPGVTFAPGASLPLRFYQAIAVDPRVIPLGTRVYIPAYAHDGHGGWFVARDTGGAINGRRIDVYRPPPSSPSTGGRYLVSQRVFVAKRAHG